MKKVKKFLIKNIKIVVAFILGIIISGGAVYAATTLYSSDQLSYTYNGQATVEGALDDLYTKASTGIDSISIGTELESVVSEVRSYDGNTIYATPLGLCITRNNSIYCFNPGNSSVELAHLREAFSDITCTSLSSTMFRCIASDYQCVYAYGSTDSLKYVFCGTMGYTAYNNKQQCYVYANGDVNCPYI